MLEEEAEMEVVVEFAVACGVVSSAGSGMTVSEWAVRARDEATSDRSGILPGRLKGQRPSLGETRACTAGGRNRPDTDSGSSGPCIVRDSLTDIHMPPSTYISTAQRNFL